MYLATLGKRALVRREMYGNLLLTIGGTIQQIIENLQLAADERLIEPLWRMQVLVDRASRAHSDDEMDRFDDELLRALAGLRTLRERLAAGGATAGPTAGDLLASSAGSAAALGAVSAIGAAGDDQDEEAPMPSGRYSARRLDDRLAASR